MERAKTLREEAATSQSTRSLDESPLGGRRRPSAASRCRSPLPGRREALWSCRGALDLREVLHDDSINLTPLQRPVSTTCPASALVSSAYMARRKAQSFRWRRTGRTSRSSTTLVRHQPAPGQLAHASFSPLTDHNRQPGADVSWDSCDSTRATACPQCALPPRRCTIVTRPFRHFVVATTIFTGHARSSSAH